MKWQNSISALVSILDNPNIESGYKYLLEYYKSNNMKYEEDCIIFLINKKFKNANNANIS